MWNQRALHRVAVVAGVLILASLAVASVGNFAPDATFTGSSLSSLRTIGQAEWRAQNGEIIGTAKGGDGGWLVFDRSYQDLSFFTSVRCAAGCKTGILVRAEKTSDGGMKGVFVDLTPGDPASYRVVLDAQGKELQREKLRAPGGGQLRVSPPPQPAAEGGRGGGRGGRGGRGGPPPLPGGIPAPIVRANPDLVPGEWNNIELVMDANILRVFSNDNTGGVEGGVAEEEFGSYGPFALYVGGTGEVRFKDIAYKDLQPRVAQPETVSDKFRMQTVNEFYYSWGPPVIDVNRDGVLDVVAGPYYYLGPEYTNAKEIYIQTTINPGTEYFNGAQFAADFTGDGWPDVLNAEFTRPAVLFVNPGKESRRWARHVVTDTLSSEMFLVKDIDKDGKQEFIFKVGNVVTYAKPDPANPTAKWNTYAISQEGPWPNHGLGVGDVNGDGRLDAVNAYGWWEQPAAGPDKGPWIYHPEAFGRWNRASPGGSEMAVYDVNGDGLNDIVTSLQAHGWGLAWFEQKKGADGKISFQQHMIMDNFSTKNAGGVTFSQLHGATYGDIDGDGVPDFITGKRFWSHLDTYLDPDPHGAPVLYVYRTVRNPKAPGGAEFVPELVHNRSGVGSHATAVDLNKDGATDIIVSTKRGTFIFWNNWKKSSTSSRASR